MLTLPIKLKFEEMRLASSLVISLKLALEATLHLGAAVPGSRYSRPKTTLNVGVGAWTLISPPRRLCS